MCVCVCAISRCTFLYLQYIYLYHTCVLKSEFGHVWLLATLVYLLKFLYVNSCVVGGHIARNLYFNFISCPLYVFIHFFCSFLYGALCPRSCRGSCAIEMSIIIIIILGKRGQTPSIHGLHKAASRDRSLFSVRTQYPSLVSQQIPLHYCGPKR